MCPEPPSVPCQNGQNMVLYLLRVKENSGCGILPIFAVAVWILIFGIQSREGALPILRQGRRCGIAAAVEKGRSRAVAAAEGGRADAARRGGRKARAVSRRPGRRPEPILLQSRASSVFVRRAGAAARGVLGGRGQTRAKGSVHITWKNL